MSRMIKVKLWYPKQKLMSVPLDIWNLPDIDDLEEVPVVLLFTGLADKKGKEIYEGDILRIFVNFIDKGLSVVKYTEAHFSPFGEEIVPNYAGTEINIVGDIFRNPELLKRGERGCYVKVANT